MLLKLFYEASKAVQIQRGQDTETCSFCTEQKEGCQLVFLTHASVKVYARHEQIWLATFKKKNILWSRWVFSRNTEVVTHSKSNQVHSSCVQNCQHAKAAKTPSVGDGQTHRGPAGPWDVPWRKKGISCPATKRHRGALTARYYVRETNPKMPHAVWVQLHDTLDKAKPERQWPFQWVQRLGAR